MNAHARTHLLASALGLAASLAVALPAVAQTAAPYAPYATAAPQAPPAGAIPSGTTITGRMQTAIDTSKAQAGQGFSMLVTRPYPNGDPGYAGAIVRGHIGDVARASQGRKPVITLVFDSIVLPSTGQSAKITGHVLSIDKKQNSAVLQQAAGAGAGMIVGNILGKALGTNAGGLLGAAAGFAYGNNRKTNYVIPQDAQVTIQTDSEVARPQARPQ